MASIVVGDLAHGSAATLLRLARMRRTRTLKISRPPRTRTRVAIPLIAAALAVVPTSASLAPAASGPAPSNTTTITAAAGQDALATRVKTLVQNARRGDLKGAEIAVSIRACDEGGGPGREIVAIDADRPMLPASNMKVVASGAALHSLGPDFRFETRVERIPGGYVLIGDGDPSLGDPIFFDRLQYRDAEGERRQLDEEAILGFWADAIARNGDEGPIDILVDDSIFEPRHWNDGTDGRDGWNPEDRLNRFSAEVAGLNFHRNTLHFRPRTSGGAKPDWTDVRPRIDGLVEASRNDSKISADKQTAWIYRRPGTNELVFKGLVRRQRSGRPVVPLEVTVHDPPMIAVELLADRVRDRGVEIRRIGRREGGPREAGPVVGPVVRMPIEEIVEHCNEESQNLYAESLLKRTIHENTGRPGAWKDANATIRRIATARIGANAGDLLEGNYFDDGSGLSRRNRITAGFLTAWLDSFHDDPRLGTIFIESLARGGEEGSLESRFQNWDGRSARVDAKSGYLTGVSCLSGFVTDDTGRRWAFSILCNGFKGSSRPAKRLQEAIVTAIADLAAP
jgi:D-alanyl-D-alanine carboxypeptidase/D-alanyl-D-alanine-endopeptidase (penicillin-binding protein 4)